MLPSAQLLIFRLEEQRYATSLAAVQRVVSAVEVTVLPKAPAIVLGVIDVAGTIIPVLNLRKRLGWKERELRITDQFLIVQMRGSMAALVIDEAVGVIDQPDAEIIGATEVVPGVEQVEGLIQLPDGLVLIHDLEKFLSGEEAQGLEAALQQEVSHGV